MMAEGVPFETFLPVVDQGCKGRFEPPPGVVKSCRMAGVPMLMRWMLGPKTDSQQTPVAQIDGRCGHRHSYHDGMPINDPIHSR